MNINRLLHELMTPEISFERYCDVILSGNNLNIYPYGEFEKSYERLPLKSMLIKYVKHGDSVYRFIYDPYDCKRMAKIERKIESILDM